MASQEPRQSPVGAPVAQPASPTEEKISSSASAHHLEGKKALTALDAAQESQSPLRAKRRASTEAGDDEVGPAVSGSATAEERAAAIEQETAAAEAAATWPRPGPLSFHVEAQDGRARAGILHLPHGTVKTPIFMPVGTNGALKGVHLSLLQCIENERTAGGAAPAQRSQVPHQADTESVCEEETTEEQFPKPPNWFSNLILGNAFHLYRQVGGKRMREVGKGLHRFMRWGANLLTDSGGFQMVSLCRLMDVFEEGVCFRLGSNGLKKESKPKKKQRQQHKKSTAEEPEATTGDAGSDKDADEIVLLTPEESIFMQVGFRMGGLVIMPIRGHRCLLHPRFAA